MPPALLARLAVALAAGVVTAAAGCSPPASPASGRGTGEHSGAASVLSVTDGDTIRVRVQGVDERVRLIGIDTPETHGVGGLRECFGAEATERTRQLLPEGSGVRLVLDAEARDRYGRLLAYVYRLGDDLFVNLVLAREGYADTLSIRPNVTHAADFAAAVAGARDRDAGLWGRCGGADVPLTAAASPR